MINRIIASNTSRAVKAVGTILLLSVSFNLVNLFNAQQANAQSLGGSLGQIRRRATEAELGVDKKLRDVQRIDKTLRDVQTILNTTQGRGLLESQKAQIRNQFINLLSNEVLYKQFLANPNIPQSQKQLLMLFKSNPQALNRFLNQQINPKNLAEQQKLQIRRQAQAAQRRLKIQALRNRLK